MKLQYIGPKKDGERAFPATGIWFPGDVREVDNTVAQQLLAHPTSWCEAVRIEANAVVGLGDLKGTTSITADSIGGGPATDIGPKPEGLSVIRVDQGWLVLDDLDGANLHALASRLELEVHPLLGETKLRAALVKAFGK